MKKYENIVFDFNGTIIDDVNLCLNILNKMLKDNNHSPITKDRYKEIFNFPIIEYYKKAGFDFSNKDNFVELSEIFTKEYYGNFSSLKMFDDVTKFLKENYKTYNLYLLSATRQDLLDDVVSKLGIKEYFIKIIGVSNILGYSKIQEANNYFNSIKIDFNKTIFVGDTLHDNEVAKFFNAQSVLIPRGHNSKEILSSADNAIIINDYNEFSKFLRG